ncbi:hypothetical protein PS910_04317 [Pseudomonas fluorescens]|nr:hypothetical protein PS910_04317 [Pseudomonas fluorescens]
MTDRIIFANTLRGFAAIFVLLSHFAGIFWVMNPVICDLLGVPKLQGLPDIPVVLTFIADNCILLGQFGVGIFFIVSGLVIPFSLRGVSKRNFLYRRALRIYPVYVVGFSFAMVALYFLAMHMNVPYKFPLFDIAAHFGVITRAPLDVPRIDGISWTLEVEIYFYLVLCVLGERAMQLDLKQYMAAIAIIVALAVLTFKTKGYLIGVQVSSGLLLILGMAYHSLLNRKISLRGFWLIKVAVSVAIPGLWLLVADRAAYTYQWMGGYLSAIAAFYSCYLLRAHFTNNRLLSHFADISYPLYVVHALFGYALMYVLVGHGISPFGAIAAAATASYLAALIIHLTIEKPALHWSKLKRRPAALG